MTIQQALDRADIMKPNMMDRRIKIAALSELDGLIHQEIILKHEHTEDQETFTGYDEDTDPGTRLIAPWPYDEMYAYWLMAKIDEQNLEMDKYNNDRALFESQYEQMSDWYTRTHMPIQRTREFML